MQILVSAVREVFLTAYFECLVAEQEKVIEYARDMFGERSRLFQPRIGNPYQIAYATERCLIEDFPRELRLADTRLERVVSSPSYRETESLSENGVTTRYPARTYIQIWMGTPEVGLQAYNSAVKRYDELCIHAHATSKCLRIHQDLYKNAVPRHYESLAAYKEHDEATPTLCSESLIYLLDDGCVEFRMFPTSNDIAEVHGWTQHCYSICRQACHLK